MFIKKRTAANMILVTAAGTYQTAATEYKNKSKPVEKVLNSIETVTKTKTELEARKAKLQSERDTVANIIKAIAAIKAEMGEKLYFGSAKANLLLALKNAKVKASKTKTPKAEAKAEASAAAVKKDTDVAVHSL